MKRYVIILLIVLLPSGTSSARETPRTFVDRTDIHAEGDTARGKLGAEAEAAPGIGGLYVGPQLGLFGSLGLRFRHITTDSTGPTLYIDAEADVGFWNELRAGVGTYLSKSNVYVGVKAGHAFLWETSEWTAVGVEVGYTIPLTKSRNWLLNIDAGIAYPITVYQVGPSAPAHPFAVPHNIRLCFQGRLYGGK